MRRFISLGIYLLSLLIVPGRFALQTIGDTSAVTNLESKVADDWSHFRGTLNPQTETEQLLRNTAATAWQKNTIPGNLGKSEISWGAFLKALVTFSEPPGIDKFIHDDWLRKEFTLNTLPDAALGIRLGKISDIDEAFLNGTAIGKTGDMKKTGPQAYDKVRIYELRRSALKVGRNVLLIHTRNYYAQDAGLLTDTVEVGPYEQIISHLYRGEFIKLVLLTTYFTAGVYFLFLFIRRPKEKENLFYALFTITLVLYQFNRNDLKYLLGIDLAVLKRIEFCLLPLVFISISHFLRAFFAEKYRLLHKVLDIFYTAIFLIFLVHPSIRIHNFITQQFFQFTIFLYLGYAMYLMIRNIRKKNKDAFYMAAGFAIMPVSVILDILSNLYIINLPHLSGHAFIVFVLGLGGVLANRFVRLNFEVEQMNENLEKKVEERTQELQQTLNEVRALKVQQDGDYYLTSLLIKPLAVNMNDSALVRIEFLINQKKKFQFKKWEAEIGGDLCIAHNIMLYGKKYLAFVNGDAMGKSIQGAGGALVLGVLFNSVVARTQVSVRAQEKHPEAWLRDCFAELQSVFTSFDGSMLISVAMGLVDETTGMLYLVNAEHPLSVLYRDGKASFLEEEISVRKIGIAGIEQDLKVFTFPMRPGDVVIAGSDGRDDIVTVDESGKHMNEDSDLFLLSVEDAKADIEKIQHLIAERGDITDDLTLMRISYHGEVRAAEMPAGTAEIIRAARTAAQAGNFTEAVDKYRHAAGLWLNSGLSLELVRALQRAGIHTEAAQVAGEALEIFPQEAEFSYLASYSHKFNRNLDAAADFGERYRLRNPDDVKNLTNLADIYRVSGNPVRAKFLAAKAALLDNSYKPLVSLLERLD